MWFFTVFSEMNSSLAMSRLFSPRATSLRTSSSRSVSRGAGTWLRRSSVRFAMSANSLRSLLAIDGLISDWPSYTARTASATSSIEISFSRYPVAPALIAS